MLSTDSPEADIRASGFVIPAFLNEEVATLMTTEFSSILGARLTAHGMDFEGNCDHIASCKMLNVAITAF